jgi:hypothetical protein
MSFGTAARARLRTHCDLRRVAPCRRRKATNDQTKQLSQTNPVHILAPCFFKMRFNIILQPTISSSLQASPGDHLQPLAHRVQTIAVEAAHLRNSHETFQYNLPQHTFIIVTLIAVTRRLLCAVAMLLSSLIRSNCGGRGHPD